MNSIACAKLSFKKECFIHCRNHKEEMLAANNQRKTYFQVNLLREFGAFTFFMFTALIQLPKAAAVD